MKQDYNIKFLFIDIVCFKKIVVLFKRKNWKIGPRIRDTKLNATIGHINDYNDIIGLSLVGIFIPIS